MTKLTASDAGDGDRFGRDVDISGDYIVVGSSLGTYAGSENAGSAYVFKRQGSGWIEQAKLTVSEPLPQPFGFLGRRVAIDGDRIVVGSWAANDAEPENAGCASGAAWVFRREGTEWIEEAKLLASDMACGDFFADPVAINGDRIAVGATGNDQFGDVTGSAYVFQRFGTSWVEQVKVTPSPDEVDYVYGWGVAVHGDLLIVGGLSRDFPSGKGKAYVYRRQGSSWIELDRLISDAPSPPAITSDAGRFVATDGREVFVGGGVVEVGDLDASGSVYVFPAR